MAGDPPVGNADFPDSREAAHGMVSEALAAAPHFSQSLEPSARAAQGPPQVEAWATSAAMRTSQVAVPAAAVRRARADRRALARFRSAVDAVDAALTEVELERGAETGESAGELAERILPLLAELERRKAALCSARSRLANCVREAASAGPPAAAADLFAPAAVPAAPAEVDSAAEAEARVGTVPHSEAETAPQGGGRAVLSSADAAHQGERQRPRLMALDGPGAELPPAAPTPSGSTAAADSGRGLSSAPPLARISFVQGSRFTPADEGRRTRSLVAFELWLGEHTGIVPDALYRSGILAGSFLATFGVWLHDAGLPQYILVHAVLGVQAAKVKRFATKVIDTNSERQIDEALWRKNVLDLHQVMFVARNLYLTLESNNEATLRVAVEIVTCIKHRRVIFWDDMWHSEDDQKRDHFKEMVADKLRQVIQGVRGADGAGAAGGKGGDQAGKGDDVEKMKAKIKDTAGDRQGGGREAAAAGGDGGPAGGGRGAPPRRRRPSPRRGRARGSGAGAAGRTRARSASWRREARGQRGCAAGELKKQMQALMRDQAAAGDSAAAGTTRLQEDPLGGSGLRGRASQSWRRTRAGGCPEQAHGGPDRGEVRGALPEIDMAAATKPLAQKLAAEKLRYEKELEALRAKARADATAALAGAEEAEALTAGLRAQLEEAQSRADDAEAKLQDPDALQRLEEARSAQLLSGACGDEAAEALRRASLAAAAEVKALQQELRAKTAETDQARAKLEKKSKQLAEKMEDRGKTSRAWRWRGRRC
ncbi:unnamed protein product [Prorocentrum cordatum]|uniref:Centrosomal protein of 44 kDa n=1 Tax=Prorocentrum cordatum TaxID=2364126 RepID=A0ABN9T3V3_9DINO|nr:unnamed protein product [Polarella glacialis]